MTGPQPDSPTAALSRRVAALNYATIPPAVLTIAKQCFLDAIGVGIAGAATEPARLAAGVALEDSAIGPCTIIGTGSMSSASGAALANGTAIHALDYDDMSVPLCGHPTAPLLPALLALGEIRHASGRELLTAFVAGYETACRVGASVDPSHYERGFHATATVGSIAAAAGAARLLELGPRETEMAIGLGATQAAGLKSMFGTMAKPLHAGRAAVSGVLAARLARDGFSSAPDSLACAQGFGETMSSEFDRQILSTEFGAPWYLLENLFKFHAACYFTHGAIEAMLELRRDGLSPDAVRRVQLRVPVSSMSVCNIVAPTTGLEAKFSLRFTAAVALARGKADESCFCEEETSDPALVELQRRIDVIGDESLSTYTTVVIIEHQHGSRVIETSTSRPRWTNDPDEQSIALAAKFHSLADTILGEKSASQLAHSVGSLEETPDIRSLASALRPSEALVS